MRIAAPHCAHGSGRAMAFSSAGWRLLGTCGFPVGEATVHGPWTMTGSWTARSWAQTGGLLALATRQGDGSKGSAENSMPQAALYCVCGRPRRRRAAGAALWTLPIVGAAVRADAGREGRARRVQCGGKARRRLGGKFSEWGEAVNTVSVASQSRPARCETPGRWAQCSLLNASLAL